MIAPDTSPTTGDYAPLAKYAILIVDDSYYARYLARQALQPLGPRVLLEAQSGAEALEIFQSRRPDLVLIDIVMENQNGLEVLRDLKREAPRAAALMVSAVDVPDILSECIALGIDDFVVKPYTAEQLQEAVLNVLAIV